MFIKKEIRNELLKSLKSKELYIEFLELGCVERQEENHEKCENFKRKLVENNEQDFLDILKKNGLID